jgi:hypothetical protein
LPAELTEAQTNDRMRHSRCAAAHQSRACANNFNSKQQSNEIKFNPTGESGTK